MALFSFTLDSFTIFETRSVHEDTDFATLSLGVNTPPPSASPSVKKSIGNVNNGLHEVGLVFANVTVNPGDLVYMSYLIVNAGHSPPDAIEAAIESAGGKLATAAGAAAAGAVVGSGVPVIGTVVGAIAGFLASELESIFTADCDGTVAAEVQIFTFDQLVSDTSIGPFLWTTQHPGTNSAAGCGLNSNYLTAWHIDAGPPKPWDSQGGGHINTGGGPITQNPPRGGQHQN
jgi:hypothetical protein